MGWGWALHFCHVAHRHLFEGDAGLQEVRQGEEGRPAPQLATGDVYGVVYVDDCGLGGTGLENLDRVDQQYVELLAQQGYILNEKKRVLPGELSYDVRLGGGSDGRELVVTPKPERAVRLVKALRRVRSRKFMTRLELQTRLGHCICVALIRNCALSIFNRLFAALLAPGHGRRYVRHEGRCGWEVFRRMVPHPVADLRADYYPQVLASDSTPTQWAVTIADADPRDHPAGQEPGPPRAA